MKGDDGGGGVPGGGGGGGGGGGSGVKTSSLTHTLTKMCNLSSS